MGLLYAPHNLTKRTGRHSMLALRNLFAGVATAVAAVILTACASAPPQSHGTSSPVVSSTSSASGPAVLPHSGLKAALKAAGFTTKDEMKWTSDTGQYVVITPDGSAIVHIYVGQGVLCSPLGQAGANASLEVALAAANAAGSDFMEGTESNATYSCQPGGSAGDSDPVNPLPSQDA